MSPLAYALLFPAGVVAGFVRTTAGLASLISYPALLVAGLPPVTANVTNTVALFGSGVGSIAGSQQELRGEGRWLAGWAVVTAAGGALGAVLLLVTPSGAFERIVPFLVALASLMLLAQPRIRALRHARRDVTLDGGFLTRSADSPTRPPSAVANLGRTPLKRHGDARHTPPSFPQSAAGSHSETTTGAGRPPCLGSGTGEILVVRVARVGAVARSFEVEQIIDETCGSPGPSVGRLPPTDHQTRTDA